MISMAAATERILYQHGDRTLWYADADDLSWRLPVFIDWRHDRADDQMYAHVQPAVCFFYSQMIAINALLEVHDIQGKKDSWVVPKRICEAILHKAPGITPSFWYKWPGADSPSIDVKPPMRTVIQTRGKTEREKKAGADPTRRSFVEWLAKERKIPSSIINAVLDAISWDAPKWMIEHHRALDLGFVRLVAVPFRANWKEIVSFKAKAHGIKLRSIFNLPSDQVEDALEEAGLPAMLTSPHNVGLRHGWRGGADLARIDYTIEAISTDLFESVASRIEGERASRGTAAYVAEFEDAVEAVYKTAVQALRAYLKKVSAPCADVLSSSDPGSIGFKPVSGRHVKVRGTPLSNLPVHIVESGNRFSVFGQSSDRRLLPPPPDEVQALPAPVQAPDDVRERTINGDLEYIGGGGDDRLRVRDDFESRPAGESVLAQSTPSGAGVGTEGDPVP